MLVDSKNNRGGTGNVIASNGSGNIINQGAGILSVEEAVLTSIGGEGSDIGVISNACPNAVEAGHILGNLAKAVKIGAGDDGRSLEGSAVDSDSEEEEDDEEEDEEKDVIPLKMLAALTLGSLNDEARKLEAILKRSVEEFSPDEYQVMLKNLESFKIAHRTLAKSFPFKFV